MGKNPDDERTDELMKEITEAGDIGDEQLPAGEIKTDKRAWNYEANRIKRNKLPDRLREFLNGL